MIISMKENINIALPCRRRKEIRLQIMEITRSSLFYGSYLINISNSPICFLGQPGKQAHFSPPIIL